MKTLFISNSSHQHALVQYRSPMRERPFQVEIRSGEVAEVAFEAPADMPAKELKKAEDKFVSEIDYQCRALGLALREK